MKVGIFIPEDNTEHQKMLTAFAAGLTACSIDYHVYHVADYHKVDIAVVFGIGKKDVPVSWARGAVIENQKRYKKDTIIIEKGFIKRDEYYMVGWNGLNNHADFGNSNSPPDRWNELGIELKPWRQQGNKVIVCGQVPSDASVQHIDIIQWCVDIIREIRMYPGMADKKIIFRPHPLALDRTPSIMGATRSEKTFEEDLKDAWAVVTYNSNAAVEAVIAGVPAISYEQGSMAYLVTGHDVRSLYAPLVPIESLRQQWVYNLAYAQWNEDEFKCGLPWRHLAGYRNVA